MNKFIIHTIFFLLGITIIFSINWSINYLIITKSDIPIKKSKILIIGDSHPSRGVNPEILENAINVCQSAEPYIITFWKLKKIITKAQPEKVIIGFSPHNISNFNDFKFNNERWQLEMFKRSYLIEEFRSINKIKIDFKQYYIFLFKQLCLFPKQNHIYYIGNHEKSDHSNLSGSQKTINKHYYFNNQKPEISETSISYLDSIINLCIKRQITPILINTPLHISYKEKIPGIIQERYNKEILRFRNQGVKIYTDSITIYKKENFYNSDHLNNSGAKIFSKKLNQAIQK